MHLHSFRMNSSGISPYSTLNENENPWFHRAAMNPNKLVCLSTVRKTGTLFWGTLCSCRIGIIRPRDFSRRKGKVLQRVVLVRDMSCTAYTSTSPAPPPGWGYSGMPARVQPDLLLGPSWRRWDPEILPAGGGIQMILSLGRQQHFSAAP